MSESSPKQTRIFLWCWPRSISTCLEKCLSFVEGVQTWHEPYTVALNAELMTNPDILEAGGAIAEMLKLYKDTMQSLQGKPNEYTGGNLMPSSNFTYPWIKAKLEEDETPDKKYIIIKDTAMAIYDHLEALPDVPTRHTFIIRHPYRFLTSQRKMFFRMFNYEGDPNEFDMFKASPLMSETLFTRDSMRLLWKYVQDTGKDPNPVIIDAEDLMNHPDKILPKYLGALGIPFDKKYITWDESDETVKTYKGAIEQVVLGKRMGVFDKAFKSSRFLPNTHIMPKKEELSPDILRMVDNVMPGYEEMFEKRLKPE